LTGPDKGALARHLADLIHVQGPLPVSVYMAEVLSHPEFGYYMIREPFGREGDFITAPEVSQMFGELIGVWCADVWQRMGAPASLRLIELGPGRGTLMVDILSALGAIPGALNAAEIHFVETSPRLRDQQHDTLNRAGIGNAKWHERLAEVPDGPAIVVANEFFDALPVRQYVHTAVGWCERLVDLNAAGNGFQFIVADRPTHGANVLAPAVISAPMESIAEICPAGQALISDIADRINENDGAALIIDYGTATSAPGDSLQAVQNHRNVPVLVAPGSADLTAHVDFSALVRAAEAAGVAAHGPVTQGSFLESLGIELRATALRQNATPEQTDDLDTAVARLTAPDQMGDLFKVLALARRDQLPPAGFSAP
jgi:NADH dehydrogenase [ubiquinone] 1 alpha subcomplex assembly factor 7